MNTISCIKLLWSLTLTCTQKKNTANFLLGLSQNKQIQQLSYIQSSKNSVILKLNVFLTFNLVRGFHFFFLKYQQPMKYKRMHPLDSLSGSKLVSYVSSTMTSNQQEAKHIMRFVEMEVCCKNSTENCNYARKYISICRITSSFPPPPPLPAI